MKYLWRTEGLSLSSIISQLQAGGYKITKRRLKRAIEHLLDISAIHGSDPYYTIMDENQLLEVGKNEFVKLRKSKLGTIMIT